MKYSSIILALTILQVASLTNASAHAVPDNVSIRAFFKPSGGRLRALVRLPVKALIDVEFPQLPGSNYLDLAKAQPYASEAARLWVADMLNLREGDTRLPRATVTEFRLSQDADPSFGSYESALAYMTGSRMSTDSPILWDHAVLDVLLETPIRSERSDFSLAARWGRLGIQVFTTVEFIAPDGSVRSFRYEGDPGPYRFNPGRAQAAVHFITMGFSHITEQSDHLLLLFCLAFLFRRLRALIPFVIVFTIAHSLALGASAYHPALNTPWAPPLVRTLVFVAILYMVSESIITGEQSGWITAIASGLIFGAAFWFELQPVLQFGGAHPLVSVLSYNAGIEIGQFLALALLVSAVHVYFRLAGDRRINTIILAGVTAHLAWHRMAENAAVLRTIPIQWTATDVVAFARWPLAIVAAGGLAALVVAFLRSAKKLFPVR